MQQSHPPPAPASEAPNYPVEGKRGRNGFLAGQLAPSPVLIFRGASGLWTLQSLELACRFVPQKPQAQPALPPHWPAFLLGSTKPSLELPHPIPAESQHRKQGLISYLTKTARASTSIQEKATFSPLGVSFIPCKMGITFNSSSSQ